MAESLITFDERIHKQTSGNPEAQAGLIHYDQYSVYIPYFVFYIYPVQRKDALLHGNQAQGAALERFMLGQERGRTGSHCSALKLTEPTTMTNIRSNP